jgi:hypothetical protein
VSNESPAPEAVYCLRHPETETGLSCGRCEAPICPQCLVHAPGGLRCPDCANLRRPPMYELAFGDIARAALAAAGTGLVLGFAGALFLPARLQGGFLFLFIALLAGSGAGVVMATVLARATRGKRGLTMQLIAVGGLVIASGARLLVGGDLDLIQRDVPGMLALAIAIATVWSRLR